MIELFNLKAFLVATAGILAVPVVVAYIAWVITSPLYSDRRQKYAIASVVFLLIMLLISYGFIA